MFKTETHLHTAEVSKCGRVSADEMIKLYSEAGYSTVFVTDHFTAKYFDRLGDMPWDNKVDEYFRGYDSACIAGEKYGVTVIRGCEITLKEGPNDYILLGLDGEFLKKREDIFDMSISELYEYVHSSGLTLIQAHPKRGGRCYPVFDYVDAVEVFNSNERHENFTEEVLALTKERGLPITAGSDAHRYEDIARSGIVTDEKITCTEDYISALCAGNIKVIYNGEIIKP